VHDQPEDAARHGERQEGDRDEQEAVFLRARIRLGEGDPRDDLDQRVESDEVEAGARAGEAFAQEAGLGRSPGAQRSGR
jgi:hypothetical protein